MAKNAHIVKPIAFIYRLFYASNPSISQIKALILRVDRKKLEIQNWGASDYFKNYLRIAFLFFFPFYFILKLKKTKASIILFELTPSHRLRKLRFEFLQQYTSYNQNDIAYINLKHPMYATLDAKRIKMIFSIWMKFLLAGIVSIPSAHKFNLSYLFNGLINICSYVLIQPEKCYTFQLFWIDAYLVNILIPSFKDIKCKQFLISSDTLLYNENRYTHLKEAELIICSHVLQEEFKVYSKNKWIQVNGTSLWGLESMAGTGGFTVKTPKYDIGLYSSGTWAREDGWFRSTKINEIREMRFLENENYLVFEQVLKKIIELKQKYDITVKVYLHPYERLLFNEHNIVAPFMPLLKQHNITFSMEGENSMSLLFECNLGISVLSSIISNRWHYALPGLRYGKLKKPPWDMKPAYLGKYQEALFDDMDQLEEKIKNILNLA